MISFVDAFFGFCFCFLMISLVSCRTQEAVETLGEFEMSNDPGIQEKIYTYLVIPGSDTVVEHIKNIDKKGDSILRIVYFNNEIDSEFIYKCVNNKKELLEEYYYVYPGETADKFEKIKGDILTYKEIDRDKKFSGLESEVSFTNSIHFRTTFFSRYTYAGDTVVLWKKDTLPSIKFQFEITVKTAIAYFPFFTTKQKSRGYSYYAKGIGFFMDKAIVDDEVYEKKLVSIEIIK